MNKLNIIKTILKYGLIGLIILEILGLGYTIYEGNIASDLMPDGTVCLTFIGILVICFYRRKLKLSTIVSILQLCFITLVLVPINITLNPMLIQLCEKLDTPNTLTLANTLIGLSFIPMIVSLFFRNIENNEIKIFFYKPFYIASIISLYFSLYALSFFMHSTRGEGEIMILFIIPVILGLNGLIPLLTAIIGGLILKGKKLSTQIKCLSPE